MADINESLLRLLDGPGPQHINENDKPEFSRGSDGALHAKILDQQGNPISSGSPLHVSDADVRSELESIKQEQEQIRNQLQTGVTKVSDESLLQRLEALDAKVESIKTDFESVIENGAIRNQLKGSLVQEEKIASDLVVSAGAITNIINKSLGDRVVKYAVGGAEATKIDHSFEFLRAFQTSDNTWLTPNEKVKTTDADWRILFKEDVQADTVAFFIKNNDTVEHTYDFWLYTFEK